MTPTHVEGEGVRVVKASGDADTVNAQEENSWKIESEVQYLVLALS